MKIIQSLILVAILFSCSKDQIQNQTTELELTWEFRQIGQRDWYPAKVPGVIHTDLLANGLIEDPFWENNEQKLQWIENENWEYKSVLKISNSQLQKDHVELIFEGLDTYAEVFINEQKVLGANNMFRSWTVDIKDYVHVGDNSIRILFTSPLIKNKEKVEKHPYKYPSGCETVDLKVSPFTRKAAYHFGWDWGPRFVTCGIWRPVKIRTWDEAMIKDVNVITKFISEKKAIIEVQLEISSLLKGPTPYQIVVNETSFEQSIYLGENLMVQEIIVEDPKLWWCNNMGEPNLYDLKVELKKDNKLLDRKDVKYGIRTIELLNEPDSIGTSFYFKLNGKPVFVKGANYIPQDMFLPRVTNEQYKKLITDVKKANMNMLRVWGGGIYENDIFYDLCDENGIMVWQDFMFAGSLYPENNEFLRNVSLEIVENIFRLRKHPCLAIFCGNNEIEVAWNNWGWQNQYNYTAEDSTRIWNNYVALFQNFIPEKVGEFAPYIPYTSTSPLSNWGKAENFNHSSMHYWGVWHGREPFENFEKNVGRFMVEYGFQSFPSMETIRRFASDTSLYLESACMKSRQKSYIGNGLILDHIKQYYDEPGSFVEFVNLSQEVQAKALQMAIRAHMKKQPHCMGSLFWQLNDCWPGPSWSVIDYYGKHKKAYEVVKKEFSSE
jgi:beta-mannosidase